MKITVAMEINKPQRQMLKHVGICLPLPVFYLWHFPGPINPLAPSDPYMGHTAQLTSRRCILNTYSTNIHTEYFKCAAQSPFFSL
jgi:hypothetical protein